MRYGELNSRGTSLKPSGYVEFTHGDNKGKAVYIVIMEEIIGRKLYSEECVHHIDEDKSNNKPSNLKLMLKSEHSRYHINKRRKKNA